MTSTSVSCIIPTHNRSEFLAAAIRCVLDQSAAELVEVLVVDDTCAAETRIIVEAFDGARPGVAVRYLARNGAPGASASRNAGAAAAAGRWLAFLDDDDVWLPGHLAGLLATTAGTARFAASWMLLEGPDGERRSFHSISSKLASTDALAQNVGVTGTNLLIERDLFARIGGFDADLPVSNDKDILVRLLEASPDYAVSEARTAVHRQHEGGQLTNWNLKRAAGLSIYYRKYKSRMTRAQRRFLSRQIYSIRRRASSSLTTRIGYTVLYLASASPRYLVAKVRQRSV